MRAKEFITELNMAPGNLMKFLQSSEAADIVAGFEVEVLLLGEYDPDSNGEPDYDYDKTLPYDCDEDDIREYLNCLRMDLREMRIEYAEFTDAQYSEYAEENLDEYIEKVRIKNPDLDPEDDADDIEEKAHGLLQKQWGRFDKPSLYEFLQSEDIRTWLQLSERYNIDWPYTEKQEFPVADLQRQLQAAINGDVIVSDEYHGEDKNNTSWYIEPDSSITPGDDDEQFGAEIVSPPMPVLEMITKLERTLKLLRLNGAETNESTGLHIGVSIPGIGGNIDYIKLALFLGDQYVLQQFGRAFNAYAKSAMSLVQQAVDTSGYNHIAARLDMMKKGLITDASKSIQDKNSDRSTSINVKGNYVEFRSMGGDYINNFTEIKNTILRYVRAYAVAADPNAETQEYSKKLARLLSPNQNDDLTPYIEFMVGNIDKNELLQQAKTRMRARQNLKKMADFKATAAEQQAKRDAEYQAFLARGGRDLEDGE